MKVTAKALEKGPGEWERTTEEAGQGRGSRRLPAAGDRALFSRSPKVSVRCIGLVFTEDKRGARGSPWGVAWWGRGLKLEGRVR